MNMHSYQKFKCKGKKIVDQFGREIIFKGVNLICKDKNKNYIGSWTSEDFNVLKQMGTNLIRLGIVWDGIEPKPGVYDKTYMSQVDKLIETAGQHNMYVYLDMHQDLYGIPIGGGAPEWATLINGYENQVISKLWSDAYITSDAVHAAFDHFWADKEAPDGVGIQTHYVNMWDMIIKRYKNNPVVIGYDVMNEPFIGSIAKSVFQKILKTYEEIMLPDMSLDELAEMWVSSKTKEDILKSLSDMDLYQKIIGSFEELCKQYDQTYYNPFMKRVSQVLRKHSQDQLLFMEGNYFCNIGALSWIDNVDGINLIYSPHGYDLVTDTPYTAQTDNNRISFIFEKHKQVQERLNVPVIVGEWGAYYMNEGIEAAAEHVLSIYEKNGWSDSFWCYVPGIQKYPSFKVLSRSYPYSLSGELIDYHFDYTNGNFSLTYKKTIDEDTIVFSTDIKRAIKALKDQYECKIQEFTENRGYIWLKGGEIGAIQQVNW